MVALDVAIWMHTKTLLENTKIPPMKIFSSGKSVYNVRMDPKRDIWVPYQNMYFGSIMHRVVSPSDFSRLTPQYFFRFQVPLFRSYKINLILYLAGPSAKEIAICECDRNLIVNLQSSTPTPSNVNFPSNNCTKATIIHQTECCLLPNGLYDIFNPAYHCCNAAGIHPIGDCWSIIYNHFILFSLTHEKFYGWNLCSVRWT